MCNDTSDESDVDPCSSVQQKHCNCKNKKQNYIIFNDSCFDQLNQDDRKCVSVSKGGSTSSNSLSQCQRLQNLTNAKTNLPNNVNSDYDCRCCHDNDDSDTSSSDSQIIVNYKRRFSRKVAPDQELVEVLNLDDDDMMDQNYFRLQSSEDSNYTTDDSSNELVEKCPICLLTFRNQEIGSPSTCQHLFCAKCIEEWSKNVRTCPIDRMEFSSILVYESYEKLTVIREISVTSDLINSAPLGNSTGIEDIFHGDDVTNCVICNTSDREEVMLLCDQCDRGYHMDCLTPPLLRVPPNDWFCDECIRSRNANEDLSISNVQQHHIILNVDLDQINNSDTVSLGRNQQPRILRTRQNERIRLSVLRRTEQINSRSVLTSNNNTITQIKSLRSKTKRKHRRRIKKRTYVKEYGLNDFNEKFAIKTIKRTRRSRKIRKRSARKPKSNLNIIKKRVNMTSSKRLAEQLGIKSNSNYTSSLIRNSTGLSLFGSKYDLEYFSDDDDNDPNIMASDIRIDNGNGTAALQTSALITNFRPQRVHKSMLIERPQSYSHSNQRDDYLNGDLLSTIMDIQERWHNVSQNLQNVRINSDGSLNLLQTENNRKTEDDINKQNGNLSLPKKTDFVGENKNRSQNTNNNDIMEAPMYSRGGGGNASFNSGSRDYNNRYNSNNQSYRGGGGSGNQYRHSNNGNSRSNSSYNMIGRGNFNFSNISNYNNTHENQNVPFSPFSIRFNPRNPSNNQRNNQRNSISTLNNSNDRSGNSSEQRQVNLNNPFNIGMSMNIPPPTQPLQRLLHQNQNITNDCNNLFAGLPPPIRGTESTNNAFNVLHSVPPPTVPPHTMSSSLNLNNATTSYSHNLSSQNDDDNSNCPNYIVYSQETLAAAKSDNNVLGPTSTNKSKEDDDMNEDLIQLDDDDIPMPPEPTSTATITAAATANVANLQNVELYEPENPTDELDDINDTVACSEQRTNEKQSVSDDDGHDDKRLDLLRQSDGLDDGNRENASQQINSDIKIDNNFSNNNDNNLSEENCFKETYRNQNHLITAATDSPLSTNLEFRKNENEISSSNRKGVLELYDDSDWEELNIDRPEGYINTTAHAEEKPPISPVNFLNDKENDNCEGDRSYTPCLDEHNDIETDNIETPNLVFNDGDMNAANADLITEKNAEKHQKNVVGDTNTELISDEDDGNHRNKVASKEKHTVNEKSTKDNIETFKKVSGKQKERNYRCDKQQQTKRSQRKYRSRSPIRSRSKSSISNRSRIKLRSRSRSRSRCRSRTKSRSPRQRGRDKQRSRSNNKENYSRWGSGSHRDRCKGSERSVKNQQRNKRRELPRYDVRNVIGYSSRRPVKDRYGRDTSRSRKSSFSPGRSRKVHPCRSSYSRSRSRSRSLSLRSRSLSFREKRNRRLSISLSPSPEMDIRKQSAPRHFSPLRRQSLMGRKSPLESYPRSPLRVTKSRSPSLITNRPCNRKLGSRSRCRSPSVETRSHRFSITPQYTPRLSRSRSITSTKGKKRKSKDKRKKGKKHLGGSSQSIDKKVIEEYNRFDVEKINKKVKYGSRTRNIHSPVEKHDWSPSPSPIRSNEADFIFSHDNVVSWTPPMHSPHLSLTEMTIPNYHPILSRSVSQSSRKEKNKRNKKKKKADKHKELRKEKKRKKQTETPETATSKEVFASGNNILVSVSFNKDASGTSQQYIPQQTIVTLPPHREDLLTNRRTSADRPTNSSSITKKRTVRRKKIDTKPVAIIDLERSPFQVQQELADVIILTDSEDNHDVQREHRREKRCSESCHKDSSDSHHILRDSVSGGEVQNDLDAMHETSYETPQTGPKTPPEPLLVKFNLQIKKQNKVRNPLHEDEDDDTNCDDSLEERSQQQSQQKDQLCPNMDAMHNQNPTKIGPNTPPESGPCSPDVYDPFEPTKSPSMSAHSPTPPKQSNDSQQFGSELRDIQPPHMGKIEDQCREHIPCLSGSTTQNTTINPVDLVMALMNSKSTTSNIQDSNKSIDSQYNTNMKSLDSREETAHDIVEENSSITVLSNVLLSTTSAQHIPSISSPTSPASLQKKILSISKMGDNIGSNNGTNIRNGNSSNVDDSFNINDVVESPYSPGSADYEDLFEPPPENINSSKRPRSKRSNVNTSSQSEVFDNLFGSSSPVGHSRLPTYTPVKKNKTLPNQTRRKSKSKAAKASAEEHKILDDIPNSAVELQVKDKFLRKLNRQERVVEEVKLVLKPRFNKKQITKEDYKEIMRRAVPKICHSKSGEIDPHKIKNLIDAYVKKFRAKHKKLNLVNTGQVSSAVKCAAYLKKL